MPAGYIDGGEGDDNQYILKVGDAFDNVDELKSMVLCSIDGIGDVRDVYKRQARGFCPRSTMRVPQPDIIEHFGNADAVPQLPERCLSHKAGIVRCCLKDTAPAHACQIPLAIWTGVWDNGLQQKAMPFAPGRIDRRNGGTGTPPDFSPKGGCFLC